MQPDLRVEAAGGDITAALRDRLVSLSVEDVAEDYSDRLHLRLDDRPGADGRWIAWPAPGAALTVWLGWRGRRLVRMGVFEVDEIQASGPPATLALWASAARLPRAIRAPRSRSWHDTTLGDIARTIAGEHALDPALAQALDTVAVPHADQTAESDLAFLTRLAGEVDAVARPIDGRLVLAPKGRAEAVSGAALPALWLRPGEVSRWTHRYAAREEAGSAVAGGGVRAHWWDRDAKTDRPVTRGADPFEDLAGPFDTEARARAAVDAAFNRRTRGRHRLSLTLPGRPEAQAEALLVLDGWRPDLPRRWRIVRVRHRLDAGGYTSAIEAEEAAADAAVPPATGSAVPSPAL